MLPVQVKMARAALGLTVRDLAQLAGVSHDTIVRIEAGEGLKPRTALAIQSALEEAGIVLVAPDTYGPGVRLREK